ncbi:MULTISPECIES: TetR/AcrR family transcriptional regulator [unclassified Streptomyces]|uniref:TetR/AcrR family transcriptional regulator n=1 Tax=unclassified Streptomyces TaxID=2593676 RepID=UPI003817E054
MPGQRADARRNYLRILAVAEEEVAAHGADASFEQIARTAGVGSATVRRHFPSRLALLEAVSRERVDALAAHARELADSPGGDRYAVLMEWFDEVVAYCVRARGLAVALAYDGSVHDNSCSTTLQEAAGPLLGDAARDGAMDPDVTAADLITLAVGFAMATEHHPDPTASARRLLRLTTKGLSLRNPPRAAGNSHLTPPAAGGVP